MRVYVVSKWPLRGRSRFVCWNITRVSLWLLCNVHFVQSKQRTRLQTRPFVRRINSLLKSLQRWRISMHPYWRVCGKNLNIVSMCAVSPVVHTSNSSSCQKKPLFSFPVAVNNSINPLNPELNPICYLLALLAHYFLHVSRIRVKSLTLRRLMSYIYGAPILDVSRSHTTTQHSR